MSGQLNKEAIQALHDAVSTIESGNISIEQVMQKGMQVIIEEEAKGKDCTQLRATMEQARNLLKFIK